MISSYHINYFWEFCLPINTNFCKVYYFHQYLAIGLHKLLLILSQQIIFISRHFFYLYIVFYSCFRLFLMLSQTFPFVALYGDAGFHFIKLVKFLKFNVSWPWSITLNKRFPNYLQLFIAFILTPSLDLNESKILLSKLNTQNFSHILIFLFCISSWKIKSLGQPLH